MSAVSRSLAALVLGAVLLAGCGTDADDNPAPSQTEPTSTGDAATASEAAPTTARGDTEVVTATSSPATAESETSSDAAGDGSVPTSGSAPASTTPPPAPPSSAAPAPAPPAASPPTSPPAATTPPPSDTGCTDDALSRDILGFPGGVTVYFCEGDWAYAVYPNAPGAPEFIAQRVDGRWLHAVAIGDPVCKDDLAARGAPPVIAKLLEDCAEPSPTTPPPTAPPTAPPTTPPPTAPPTEPPAADCIISTKLYGDTIADLTAVTCSDAAAEWGVAEANAEPSWNIPWITPTGWECYVSPYDPESKAAGACYAPVGNAQFTLYVQ